MDAIIIEASRDAYGVDQIAQETMTVSELIDCLQEMADAYGDDVPVVVSNDHGYTYGSLGWESVDTYGEK